MPLSLWQTTNLSIDNEAIVANWEFREYLYANLTSKSATSLFGYGLLGISNNRFNLLVGKISTNPSIAGEAAVSDQSEIIYSL